MPILLGTGTPEVLGELTLGFVLDDRIAVRLRGLTGSHVAVTYEGRVHATTLSRTHDTALLAAVDGAEVLGLRLDGDDWVALQHPLVAGGDGPSVLVLRSRAEALRPLDTLRAALAVAALVAVAVSLLLSWAVARTVTRPLAALTDGMKEIAATGDLTREIRPARAWDDEDARLVGPDLQHPHRLDRTLPEGGRPARPALSPRPALHDCRSRGAQPPDDHQGIAPDPAS